MNILDMHPHQIEHRGTYITDKTSKGLGLLKYAQINVSIVIFASVSEYLTVEA